MCQEKCPVKINTGELIKTLRQEALEKVAEGEAKPRGAAVAAFLASHFGTVSALVPPLLNTVSVVHSIIGSRPMNWIAGTVWGVGNNMVPLWNEYMPRGAQPLAVPDPKGDADADRRKVVYLASCVTRMMGPARGDEDAGEDAVHAKLISLLEKAGYDVVVPEGIGSMCCGMIFDSRGFRDVGASQASDLQQQLLQVSEGGKLPIICDTSPCLQRMKEKFDDPLLKFALCAAAATGSLADARNARRRPHVLCLPTANTHPPPRPPHAHPAPQRTHDSPDSPSRYEPVQFISMYLKDRLQFQKVRDTVAVHVPCSSKKLKLNDQMVELAELCAREVHVTPIPCCGMAGDRGMRYPELTEASLQHLELPSTCSDGYSTSRTCEMSLSNHSGINFRSLLYLVDEATGPKERLQQEVASTR